MSATIHLGNNDPVTNFKIIPYFASIYFDILIINLNLYECVCSVKHNLWNDWGHFVATIFETRFQFLNCAEELTNFFES